MKLITDRGWTWTSAQWELMLSLGPGLGAFDGGALLGTALSTPYPEAQAISGVLVGTWAERRGVGTALMSNILDISPTPVSVLYATAMGEPLYAKLGFHPVEVTTEYHGVLTGAAAGVTRPVTEADLPVLAALDREVSGYSRTAFWDFAPSKYSLHVAEFAGGLGVVGTRALANGRAVGPLIAPTAADACAMISDVVVGEQSFRIDTTNADVAAYLLAGGFEPRKGCSLMVYGATEAPGDRSRYFTPASLALG
ncbi:GNAT family N-acetyltransferase [Lentzea sp. NEAU-D13]|uniref:GNAT family N-acetyltransferase n=1 Tax=Lentzea alba TaxID=2714351 RepID=A0A7C9VWI5_9PSEU|nr:GNAT family N-acetyltransferase [Lentzea alba]NGY62656.1 GNAT family N-acetyltransferase [Lentzea alba]